MRHASSRVGSRSLSVAPGLTRPVYRKATPFFLLATRSPWNHFEGFASFKNVTSAQSLFIGVYNWSSKHRDHESRRAALHIPAENKGTCQISTIDASRLTSNPIYVLRYPQGSWQQFGTLLSEQDDQWIWMINVIIFELTLMAIIPYNSYPCHQ